jgi:RNA-directed DNA polymerase
MPSPSTKERQAFSGTLSISRQRLYKGIDGIVKELNPLLTGWKNYFEPTTVKREFHDLDFHIIGRFYRVAKKTSQRPSRIFRHGVYATLKHMGLRSLCGDRPVNAFR